MTPVVRELRPLFRTQSGACYTQDPTGRIYRDGEPVYSGPLFAVSFPPNGVLVVGASAMLFFDSPTRIGWRVTTPIVELFAQPVVAAPAREAPTSAEAPPLDGRGGSA